MVNVVVDKNCKESPSCRLQKIVNVKIAAPSDEKRPPL
jgi:hypothetical protein